MDELEIRHAERDILFKLLVAKHTNNIDFLLANQKAKMEQEDVQLVENQFNIWKNQN
jgi:hypothetical protein